MMLLEGGIVDDIQVIFQRFSIEMKYKKKQINKQEEKEKLEKIIMKSLELLKTF